jgi:hypothetical protein
MLDLQSDRFRESLEEWRQLDPAPVFLCYVLSHQHTEAGLKLASLKGKDSHRARFVADACSKAGDFYVLLASIKSVVTFSNDEGGDETKQSKLVIRVVDLDGSVIAPRLIVPENAIMQEIYKNRDPDERLGGEYLGNQHAEFEQSYHDTVRSGLSAGIPKLLISTIGLAHCTKNLGHTISHGKPIWGVRVQGLPSALNEDFRGEPQSAHPRVYRSGLRGVFII